MCEHSWYDRRYKRHYGPKPNTRRERGLPRRDKGKHHKFLKGDLTLENLPDIQVEEWVGPPPEIPKNETTQMVYVRMYNFYVREFECTRDKEQSMLNTMEHYHASVNRVIKAIRFSKYILATQ